MRDQGLSVHNLTFEFPLYGSFGYRSLFTGLDYFLPGGGLGVILGGADAGKTTLARIMAGLVPRFTGGDVSGSLSFKGINLLSAKPYQLMENLGIVFQDSDDQLFTTRCDMEVAFALESLGVPRDELRRRVDDSLALMGLRDFRTRNPATLSGGEKKRLLLACLAAVDPELWILDEAMEELDDQWKSILVDHLRSGGKTALFLDSRWSPLFLPHKPRVSILNGGMRSVENAPNGLEEAGLSLAPGFKAVSAPAASPRSLLEVRGLSFRFPGEGAFEIDIPELTLRSGQVCSLLGKNGSGKSTLGRLLCGLLAPGSGNVRLETEAGAGEPLSHGVGYMFQNPDYQIFLPTVFEELAYGLRYTGLGRAEIERRVEETVARFHLPPGESPPALMSYGARKRLQAATYHLLRRDFLILDEIDSGLSYGEFLPVLDALKEGGAGIVIVTHDAALARAVSSRILVMEEGKISSCAEGAIEESEGR